MQIYLRAKVALKWVIYRIVETLVDVGLEAQAPRDNLSLHRENRPGFVGAAQKPVGYLFLIIEINFLVITILIFSHTVCCNPTKRVKLIRPLVGRQIRRRG